MQQLVAKLDATWPNPSQGVAERGSNNLRLQSVIDEMNLQQVVANKIFQIPWGHHQTTELLCKVPDDFKSQLPTIEEIETELANMERG